MSSNDINYKFIKHWKATRRLGILRFIIVNGMLKWGIPMFVFMTTMQLTVNSGFISVDKSMFVITFSFIFWIIAGIIFGYSVYKINENKYNKLYAQQGDAPETTSP